MLHLKKKNKYAINVLKNENTKYHLSATITRSDHWKLHKNLYKLFFEYFFFFIMNTSLSHFCYGNIHSTLVYVIIDHR